jgi:O-antigen/teichoic acid export membrane protein
MAETLTVTSTECAAATPVSISGVTSAPHKRRHALFSGPMGAEVRRLVHHSSHYLIGMVASMALGLVSFPIFTRVFSVAEYGTIDLAQRVLLMVTIASKAGFQNAALRFYDKTAFENDRAASRRYYSTMFFGMFGTATSIVLAFLLATRLAPQVLTSGAVAYLAYLIAGLVLARAIGSVLWAFLRIEERTKLFNITSVSNKAASVAVICALLPIAGRSAQTYFGGSLLVEGTLMLGLTAWLLKRRVLAPLSFDAKLFRAGLAFGMPLIVYEFAFAVLGSADRFLVRHYLGADALGFYSVAHGLARTANEFLVAPLSLAILPIYLRLWSSEGVEKTVNFLTVSLDLFLIVACGIVAATAACGDDVVALLASSKYAGAGRIVPVLLAGLLVYATHVFAAAGLLIYKRTLQMAGLLVVSAVFNVGLNIVLLPRLGLMGGAISTLVSYTLCMVMLGIASRRVLPMRLNIRTAAVYIAAAAVAWLVASRVDFGSRPANMVARSAATFAVYGAILVLSDSRIRGAAAWAWSRCREQVHAGTA